MKVYISADMEGVAGVVGKQQLTPQGFEFQQFREFMTAEVNAAIEAAASGPMAGILAYDPAPKVSIDFNHTTQSSIFAPEQTKVIGGTTVRVLSWYDNEWGFSVRMADLAAKMGQPT